MTGEQVIFYPSELLDGEWFEIIVRTCEAAMLQQAHLDALVCLVELLLTHNSFTASRYFHITACVSSSPNRISTPALRYIGG